MSATAAVPQHGTPERWQADCECPECETAMQEKVWNSNAVDRSRLLLANMLDFRVRGCELYLVPAMLAATAGMNRRTVQRHIDSLIEVGVVSKIREIEGQSGRSGIYLLHVEKLRMRPYLKMWRESQRLQHENGSTKITSWRMLMLKEHEASGGVPCARCGNFPVEDGGVCAHCCCIKTYDRPSVPCPVCQDREIPKVLFEPQMRTELERVEKARTAFSQPRRLILVKS